ncbi:MAG: hypothetical protein ABIE94_06480, partial [archaeon]
MIRLFSFKERKEIKSLKESMESLKNIVADLDSSIRNRHALCTAHKRNKKFQKVVKSGIRKKKTEQKKHKETIQNHKRKVKHLERKVHEIHKNAEKVIPVAILIALFVVFGAYIFTERLGFTGLIIGEQLDTYTINVDEVYTENSEYMFVPEGPLHSLSVSGSIIGNGTVRMYLTDGTTTYLILDSKEAGLTGITGMVTDGDGGDSGASDSGASDSSSSDSGGESSSESSSESSDSGTDSGGESSASESGPEESSPEPSPEPEVPPESEPEPEAEAPAEPETPTEELPAEEPPAEEEQPTEEEPVEEPAEPETPTEEPSEQELEPGLNETIEQEPEVNESIEPEVNITEESEPEINETINVTEEPENVTEKPEAPAEEPVEEDIGGTIPAEAEQVIYFEDICLDTCLLPDLEIANYTIIIEVENATLDFDTLTYTVAIEESVSSNETLNMTENISINITENITINITENVTANITINITENISINLTENITINITEELLFNFTINITGNITNTTEEFLTRVTINGPAKIARKITLANPANNIKINVPGWATKFNVTNLTRPKILPPVINEVDDDQGEDEQEPDVVEEEPPINVTEEINESTNKTKEKEEKDKETEEDKETGQDKEEKEKKKDEEEIEFVIIEEEPEGLGGITGDVIAEEMADQTGLWNFFTRFFKWLFSGEPLTGFVIQNFTINETGGGNENITLTIITEEPVEELILEYEMPGPTAVEEDVNSYTKRMVVSSEFHYENILSYMTIPEASAEGIRLYWFNESSNGTNTTLTRIDVTDDPTYELTFYDTNDNGKVDLIEWNIPHLSNESFEVTIMILNVQSYPSIGGTWTVEFNTTGEANLTIMAVNGTTWSNVNETEDLMLQVVGCGNQTLNYTWIKPYNDSWINSSVFIANYTCNQTGYETSKVLTPGKHDLHFDFGGVTANAHNLAGAEEYDMIACYDDSTSSSNIKCRLRNASTRTWITEISSGIQDFDVTSHVRVACNPQGDECTVLSNQLYTLNGIVEIDYLNLTGMNWVGDAVLSTDIDAGQDDRGHIALAYEPDSGDLLVMYGTDGEADPSYRTKTRGSTLSGATVESDGIGGDTEWIKMYPDYHNSGDSIIILLKTNAADVMAMRWDGSAWKNKTTLETACEATADDVDIAYVPSTNQYWFTWCDGADLTGGAEIRGYDRDTNIFTAEVQMDATGDECRNAVICGHQTKDMVTVCVLDAAGGLDLNCNIYNISADSWVGNVEVEDNPANTGARRSIDCVWESDNDFGVIVYGNKTNTLTYRTMTSEGISSTEGEGDVNTGNWHGDFIFVHKDYGNTTGLETLLFTDNGPDLLLDYWNESSNAFAGAVEMDGSVGVNNNHLRFWGTYINVGRTATDVRLPSLTWQGQTPGDGDEQSDTWVFLNATVTDGSNTSAFIDWDNSLKGYWSFDYYDDSNSYDNSSYGHTAAMTSLSSSDFQTGVFGDAVNF